MPRQAGSQVLQQLQAHLQEHEVDSKKSHTLPFSEKSDVSSRDNSLHSSGKINKNANSGSSSKSTGVSFGKGIFKLRLGKRSTSEPRLGDGFLYLKILAARIFSSSFLS